MNMTMDDTKNEPETFIHRFIQVATSRDTTTNPVVECCRDILRYGQLLAICQQLANDILSEHGERPTVAIISENHPYILAVILATWMIGGVAAPMDVHAPEPLLRGMLDIVRPNCVVIPDTAEVTLSIVKASGYTARIYRTSECSIPHLVKKLTVNGTSADSHLLPRPSDIALYLYTSSASSVEYLKCVPLEHGAIYHRCRSQLSFFRKEDPSEQLDHQRVLSWGPWSHIMALAHDIGCHGILTAGCIVFGVPPSTYPRSRQESAAPDGASLDTGAILLRTAAETATTVFSGVPWIIKKFKLECEKNPEYLSVLQRFHRVASGGAKTSGDVMEWAMKNGIKFVHAIGMTELAGGLFHERVTDPSLDGFKLSSCLVEDGQLTLIDDSGKESEERGELVIRSKYLCKGYRNISSNAFSNDSEGYTTFQTGDIYCRQDDRLVWEGRREDYIQLLSGEILDPRKPERDLDSSPFIERSCIVGNRFLRGASEFICAIIEPLIGNGVGFQPKEIMSKVSAVNRTLSPPLRVPWSRVLVLGDGERIPMNRKGLVWRKALEERFKDRLDTLLENPRLSRLISVQKSETRSQDQVEESILRIVSETLGIPIALLRDNMNSTFADFGMDSQMAATIVTILNSEFNIDLPLTACHDHVDILQLSTAVYGVLNTGRGRSSSFTVQNSIPADTMDEVVIIGQAMRLPGGVSNVDSFWKALIEQRKDIIEEIPNDRWDHSSFYSPERSFSGSINFNKTGRIDVAEFDNSFFGISPAEAFYVTPLARVTLEVVIEALENANIPPSSMKSSNAGVFVGLGPDSGYSHLLHADKGFEGYERFYGAGIAGSSIPGRISYFLDIHGPSVSVDTACSSGMVAFSDAVNCIQQGYSEMAIVSSVNLHLWPGSFSFLSANKMASPNGRCATFTKDADGYVPSEGALAFVLKSKRAALRDKDTILAVVKSTSVQHNGRSQGLVAPNSKAQAELQRTIIRKAGLRTSDIRFLETHGTGTILGDLMEAQATNEVFAGSHTFDSPLVLGAAKTVFGHTESSAGLVGIAKAIQSIRTALVPGLAHLTPENLNPNIDTSACPLIIPHKEISIAQNGQKSGQEPIRALVLAYGFAGTISGTIIEEYQPQESAEQPTHEALDKRSQNLLTPLLFVISAKSEEALKDYARNYIDYCSNANESDLANICYTSCVGREHYRFRFSCVCSTLSQLLEHLREFLFSPGASLPISSKVHVAFALPGQGTYWNGMAKHISTLDSNFAAYLRDYAEQACSVAEVDVISNLLRENGDIPSDNENDISQVCIFIFQCAICRWLQNLGINPQAIIAHSLGELAAAVVSGCTDFRTAIEFLSIRSHAMKPLNSRSGSIVAIRAPSQLIIKRINDLGLNALVNIAAFNSSEQHVVSGETSALSKLASDLSSIGIKCSQLPVNQGYHSHCIDHSLTPINKWVKSHEEAFACPNIPFYSSALGRCMKSEERLNAEYWVNQARNPVLFSDAAGALLRGGSDVIIDIGPQNVVASLLNESSFAKTTRIISLCSRPQMESLEAPIRCLANLFMQGVAPDFHKLYSGLAAAISYRKVSLPTYPWQRQRFYPNSVPSRNDSARNSGMRSSPSTIWGVADDLMPLLQDNHTVRSVPIVPAAALAIFASQKVKDSLQRVVSLDLRILKPIVLAGSESLRFDISGGLFSCSQIYNSHPDVEAFSGCGRVANIRESTRLPPPECSTEERTINRTQIYEKLTNSHVRFGTSFQALKQISLWSNKAEGIVEALSFGNAYHDFVVRLDACLHMLGVITSETPSALGAGSYLPASLSGFILYCDAFPPTFTCRYRLPVEARQSGRKITASFEVFSDSGALLASCAEYSVAWIPENLPIVPATPARDNGIPLLRTAWKEETPERVRNINQYHSLLYCGSGRLEDTLRKVAAELGTNMVKFDDVLPPLPSKRHEIDCSAHENATPSCMIVYDASSAEGEVLSVPFLLSKATEFVDFIRSLALHIRAGSVVSAAILTENGLGVVLDEARESCWRSHENLPGSQNLTYNILQGMLRVLRQEFATDVVWGLDFTSDLSSEQIRTILLQELSHSHRGLSSPVAYRLGQDRRLVRFVPHLKVERDWLSLSKSSPASILRTSQSKKAIILGMGDIGLALAKGMIETGWSSVIFLSRKSPRHPHVISTLRELRADNVDIRYIQVDLSSGSEVRSAMATLASVAGLHFKAIIYTAGIVKDALIENTRKEDVLSVLSAKAVGAWNLHQACLELGIGSESFILLSSVSVILGNPGQIAYVGANSFLDALAEYRQEISDKGQSMKSYSVQLGAWQSALTSALEQADSRAVPVIKHSEGIPLLLQLIEGDIQVPTVSVLAKFRPSFLRGRGLYSVDPFFTALMELDADDINGRPKLLESHMTESDIREFISTKLRDILGMGNLRMEQLDSLTPLDQLGVDSIAFTQLRGMIFERCGVEIPLTLFSDDLSVGKLTDFIMDGSGSNTSIV